MDGIRIGRATIYNCDFRDVSWPELNSVLVSDPPYGCSATTGRGGAWSGFSIAGDESTELRDAALRLIDGPFAVFGSPRIQPPAHYRAKLIWAKGEHTGMGDLSFPWKPDYEEIYIGGPGWSGHRGSSVISVNARTDSGRHHPTEKPVELMAHLIEKAPCGIICDPFMGSGSTGVAALQAGRDFIGCEVNPSYFATAVKRLTLAASQPRLFD